MKIEAKIFWNNFIFKVFILLYGKKLMFFFKGRKKKNFSFAFKCKFSAHLSIRTQKRKRCYEVMECGMKNTKVA